MSWKWERSLATMASVKLMVTSTSWGTEAYFRGPDLRYNGTFWRLASKDVGKYVQALLDSWAKLEALEKLAPPSGDLSAYAAMNIRVVVRGYPGRGVTFHHHHGHVKTKEQLDRIVDELRGLEAEALGVQGMFQQ